jgi:hypothetical protein
MKRCVWVFFLLLSFWAQAQKPKADFWAIDNYVQSVKATAPDSLAHLLTFRYTTDLEKVRAVYSWICQNIRYNVDIFRPLALRARYVPEPIDTLSEWKPADEMYARKVLRRGVAVCEGYSRLFKTLCELTGVEAVVLNGYVRTNLDRSAERFKTNHTWNAVRIDSTWHLVDVTWGAGYIAYGDEFVQKQNDFYFLTPPEELIRDHYPEDLRWTLMAEPPKLAEFRKMPFRSKSFVKYGIQSYSPSNGSLEAEVGDTLSFTLSIRDISRSKSTSPDPFFDTASFALSPNSVFIKPEREAVGQVSYRFVVDETTQWVHLLFNDDVVLRYNISRRRSLASN